MQNDSLVIIRLYSTFNHSSMHEEISNWVNDILLVRPNEKKAFAAQYNFHYYPYLSTDEWNTEAEDNIQNKALRLIYYMLLDLRFM